MHRYLPVARCGSAHTPSTWSVYSIRPPGYISIHTKQRRGSGDNSNVSRHPAGRAASGARGRAARPADAGVMARRCFDAAPTGDVADIVRMDARAVEVVLLGCSSSPQCAGWRSAPAQDARLAGVSAATLPTAGVDCRASSSSSSTRITKSTAAMCRRVVAEILIDLLAVAPRQDGHGATWRDPPRCAASTFSAMPPTGSTCPARAIWRWACRVSRWTRAHSRSRWQCIRSASPSGRWNAHSALQSPKWSSLQTHVFSGVAVDIRHRPLASFAVDLPQVAQVPDRASALMCRTGAPGSVSQDFLRAFVGVVGRCARIDAECRRYRRRLGGRTSNYTARPGTTAASSDCSAPPLAHRRAHPARVPTCRLRRAGAQDSSRDHRTPDRIMSTAMKPDRDTRLPPSVRRLAKGDRDWRQAASARRAAASAATRPGGRGKEAP